jgi:hypothetical protein
MHGSQANARHHLAARFSRRRIERYGGAAQVHGGVS